MLNNKYELDDMIRVEKSVRLLVQIKSYISYAKKHNKEKYTYI